MTTIAAPAKAAGPHDRGHVVKTGGRTYHGRPWHRYRSLVSRWLLAPTFVPRCDCGWLGHCHADKKTALHELIDHRERNTQ